MELRYERENPWVKELPAVWAKYDLDCGLVAEEEDVSGGPVPFQEEKTFPQDLNKVVGSLLQQMLKERIVVRGSSPSNSPLILFSKDSGDRKTWRLTLDFKAIHRVTPWQPTESLDRRKAAESLSPRSRYFSTLDLSCCSFAIPLTAASRPRFAFTFQGQQYLFTRLPPCFRYTSSIVHRRVARMLAQLPPEDRGWMSSYEDDIIIAGKNLEVTESRTKRVLELIQVTGFKVKLRKAQLVKPEVDYLGMRMSARGWELQERKKDNIVNMCPPRDLQSLRSLLGMMNSCRDHVDGYAELERPLQKLLGEEWHWGQTQQQVLWTLVQAIQTAPALRFLDRSQPFIVRATVGNEAMGAALLQEDEKGRMVPVRFSSHVLKKHQVHFSPEEKDCLAVVSAVHAFRDLIGPAPIVVQMPSSPRKYLLWGDTENFCWPTPCKRQWNLLLVSGGRNPPQPHSPTAPQPLGSLVYHAPPLQQLPCSVPHSNVWFTAGSKAYAGALGFAATNLEERWLLGLAQGSSVVGAELEAIKVLLQKHQGSKPLYIYINAKSVAQGLEDGCSEDGRTGGEELWWSILQWLCAKPRVLHVRHCRNGEELVWSQKAVQRAQRIPRWVVDARGQQQWEPSKHERQEIVALSHKGHMEVMKMLSRVRKVARWEGDRKQVAQWVQHCCCTRSPPLPQRMEGPWSWLQLAHIKELPVSLKGFSSLLVLLDEFSGWVDAFPMRKGDAEEMAMLLQEHVEQRLGTPCRVTVELSEHILQYAVQMGLQMYVDRQHPSVYQVAAVATSLQRLAQSSGKHWADSLSLILAALRATCVRSAVLGPYQLSLDHPLVLRVIPCEEEAEPGPTESLLPWLARLREDRAEYKQGVKEAMKSVRCDAE